MLRSISEQTLFIVSSILSSVSGSSFRILLNGRYHTACFGTWDEACSQSLLWTTLEKLSPLPSAFTLWCDWTCVWTLGRAVSSRCSIYLCEGPVGSDESRDRCPVYTPPCTGRPWTCWMRTRMVFDIHAHLSPVCLHHPYADTVVSHNIRTSFLKSH